MEAVNKKLSQEVDKSKIIDISLKLSTIATILRTTATAVREALVHVPHCYRIHD